MNIKRTTAFLIGIVLLGLLLRVGTARNMHLSPDELVYAVTPINIISTGRISTFHQSPVYFYLTDMGYKLFGVNAITSRLVGIIFGTLTIVVVYLLAKEILREERYALLAAFFFAVSAYAIRNNTEMDGLAIFFIMASVLFYIKGLREKDHYFLPAAVFLGLAVLNKPFSALLAPIYIVYYVIYHRGIPLPLARIKIIGLSIGIILLMAFPILWYNYAMYTQKNMLDVYLAPYVDELNKEWYDQFGLENPWTVERFKEVAKKRLTNFFSLDPILSTLALLGLALMIKKREKFILFFILFMLIYITFLWGTPGGGGKNHQVLFFPLFAILGTYGIKQIIPWIPKVPEKKMIIGLLITTGLLSGAFLFDELTQKSALVQLREAVSKTIEDNTLVMADQRIYVGNQAWVLHDTNYIDTSLLKRVLNELEQIPAENKQLKTYYIECVNKDCGWGRGIKENKEFQALAEQFAIYFQDNGQVIAEVIDGRDHYRIYEANMLWHPLILTAAEQIEGFYGYPVGWKGDYQEKVFDEYDRTGLGHPLGRIILWGDILLVFLSAAFVIRQVFKESAILPPPNED